MAKTCECGRDRAGIEPVEYCDSRFLAALDIGRGRLLRRTGGGDVMRGGRGGRLGFDEGDRMAAGDVAGDEVDDITTVVMMGGCEICYRVRMLGIQSAVLSGEQQSRWVASVAGWLVRICSLYGCSASAVPSMFPAPYLAAEEPQLFCGGGCERAVVESRRRQYRHVMSQSPRPVESAQCRSSTSENQKL